MRVKVCPAAEAGRRYSRRGFPENLRPALNTQAAPPVQVENVSKIYGRTAAVRDVSLTLAPGRFYVLRGENGAGKSTLLRMIAGLNAPTQGQIFIFGKKTKDTLAEIGYMAHAPLLYDEFSGMENLRFFAELYGVSSDVALTAAMQRVGLDPTLARRVGQYSQGMRQRLSLARAIFHSPRLILLDEPFSNVDPEPPSQIANLLAHMRSSGHTILLVPHQLGLLADMAGDLVVFLPRHLPRRARRAP